ncbi:monoterpene synthase TPS4, chloroplastic-like isoform X2 [Rutidosis leptorrhynchoides]|uniref:monoterpene synthase TPS4, chloroplastic-like isoform X2 n=1 Tax=Rutidosis leptorrhynchoides TaxID=125765 RepID=UPI003A9A459A
MTSQFCITSLLTPNGNVSNKVSYQWKLMNISPYKSSNRCTHISSSSTLYAITNITNSEGLVRKYQPQFDANIIIKEHKESTRRALTASSNPTTTLTLIDNIQRLGIGYHFEEEINEILINLARGLPDEDLYTTALHFRLQRHNGIHSNPVFHKFMDAKGELKKSLCDDIEGLLSLYEASYLGANGEDILSHAKEFTTKHIRGSSSFLPSLKLEKEIVQSLEVPRHMRMERLEARRYIEEYGNEEDHNPMVLEFAKLDYNHVQSLFQKELVEITRWWKHLGVASKVSFVRDRHVECFLWIVGLLPEPKYTKSRIVLAKAIAIMLVIDDIYDTYGSYDDLALFTKAIQRWDLNEMEKLPEYMQICFMALYDTNNEICDQILIERGLNAQPILTKTWIDLTEAYMLETEWVKKGTKPKYEEYIDNGVRTSGTHMALVHLFVLVSEGVTNENIRRFLDPYPKFFSLAGTILRLWDDLGTSKEEEERGDVLSSIKLVMKERNIACEEEGRKHILGLIHGLWKDLNAELVTPDVMLLPIIRVALNTSRASQVVYQHDEDSYLSSVKNHVQSLFFKPVDF